MESTPAPPPVSPDTAAPEARSFGRGPLVKVLVGLVAVIVLAVAAFGIVKARGDDGDDGQTGNPPPAQLSPLYDYDGSGADVSAARFGSYWPLTVKSGRVDCSQGDGGLQIVFTADNGTKYGLNAAAQSANSYEEIQDIQLDDPATGMHKDMTYLDSVCMR